MEHLKLNLHTAAGPFYLLAFTITTVVAVLYFTYFAKFYGAGAQYNSMKKNQLISSDIERFYNKASEEERLSRGMGIFEFERIRQLISRYLHSTSQIVDVGGGTGKYAEWLAREGHKVCLIEPVDKHLRIAQERSERLRNKFKVLKGAAAELPFPDRFADVVILHGPLYHLQRYEDRLTAICEARRVLKKGGVVLGFGISHTASMLAGLLNGLVHKPSFLEMCKAELVSGLHNPPDEFPWLLAEAFYHKPSALRKEFEACGLKVDKMFAVEGPIWLDRDFFSNMAKEQGRAALMELLHTTESEESLLSISPHIMIAGIKHT